VKNVLELDDLRKRTSQKWSRYGSDVLPAFVAESDYPASPNVARALREAIDNGDLGYAEPKLALGNAYSRFAQKRYGIETDPGDVTAFPEVMVAAAEVLRRISQPGDEVVVNPPVYPPFFATIAEVRRTIVSVPLIGDGVAKIDFTALDRAFADGARVYLLCNPHNPVGRAFNGEELARVADLAEEYDVAVLADEIHGPLVLQGRTHTPFESVVKGRNVRSITFTSASKGWNIAGLKCALAISSSSWGRSILASLKDLMEERTGHLGVIATVAAFESDGTYLDDVVAHLSAQRHVLKDLLDANGLESVGYTPPEAGFLAWLDCRHLGLGTDPAKVFLDNGRVALARGLDFGAEGSGYARLNFATSAETLSEIVRRMRAGVRSR
jgi:cystathionine beta-lyase